MDLDFLLGDSALRRDLILSVVVLLAAMVLRAVALRGLRNLRGLSEPMRLRWTSSIRSAALLVVTLSLIVIWASELQAFAVSVLAIAAAIVLALKELIMCVSGSLIRASAGSFSIGDRVEIGGVRGDVIDSTLLATTLLEVGSGHQRTGRAVVVPNSVMLSQPVVNETFTHQYVLTVMSFGLREGDDWERAEATLLQVATEACAEHIDPARAFMDELAQKHGLPQLSVEPRVHVSVNGEGALNLVLRIPSPVRERGRLEQRILRDYLAQRRAEAAA